MYCKKPKLLLMAVVALTALATAEPSYLWYRTYSVENYNGNGCDPEDSLNLPDCHNFAQGFVNAVEGHDLGAADVWLRGMVKDTDCVASNWTTTCSQANDCDFINYNGHGNHVYGPYFGADEEYQFDIFSDVKFGGLDCWGGYLKWVQLMSCLSFYQAFPVDAWDDVFDGVHSVMGYRSDFYGIDGSEAYNTQCGEALSNEFWDNWVDGEMSINASWICAQRDAAYYGYLDEQVGIEPGIVAALGMLYETWASADDDPAGAGTGSFQYVTYGDPTYYGE